MNYSEFNEEIKAGLPHTLYVLAGEEDFLKEHSAARAKSALVEPSLEDFNFLSLSELPEASSVRSFTETLPMMSERKLLVLRRCGFFGKSLKQKSDWEEIFTSLPEYMCVLLWEDEPESGKKSSAPLRKVCEKAGVVVDFPLQTESKLIPWLAKIADSGGKLIDRDCASYIIASLGRRMGPLASEMRKITAYSPGKQITRADVDAVIVRPVEDKVFKLVDAIMDGRRDRCYSCLNELRRNRTEPVAFLSLLAGRLITIYRARLLLDEGIRPVAAAKELGGGWAAEKCVRQAQSSADKRLERLICLCREADRDIKLGRIEPWAALDIIVAEMEL